MTTPAQTVGNAPLVVGQAVQLRPSDPQIVTTGLVLQNFSAYQLAVRIGADSYSLGPYTQDKYPAGASGAVASVVALNSDNADTTLPAYVNAQWLTDNDTPQGSYPGSLSPPAAAIALSTANALFSSGVPNVLISATLVDEVTLVPGQSVTVNVSKYASIVAGVIPSGVSDNRLEIIQFLTIRPGDITQIARDLVVLPVITDFITAATIPGNVVMQCLGTTMQITNQSGTPLKLYVVGTNRPVGERVSTHFGSGADSWFLPSQAFAANSVNPMTHESGYLNIHGECTLIARLGTTAGVTAAQINMNVDNGYQSFSAYIADTKEPAAYVGSDNSLYVSKTVFVPMSATFSYIPRVAGTVLPYLRLLPRTV